MTTRGLFDDMDAENAANGPGEAVRPDGGLGTPGHALFLASAGTGKTYRLSGHFAALLVAGVDPKNVLATTFTRKAAGEILDRVLQRLRDGARDDAQGAALRAEIASILPGAPKRTAGEYRVILSRLVRSLDRFQVRTLDAFFARLAQAFAAELELRNDWHIEDDVERRRHLSESLARMLDDLTPEERLELVRGIVRSNGSRAATSALSRAVDKGDAAARIALPMAWGVVSAPDLLDEGAVELALDAITRFEIPVTDKKKPKARWVAEQERLRALVERARAVSREERREPLREAFQKGIPKAVRQWMLDGRIDAPQFYKDEVPSDIADAAGILDREVTCLEIAELVERNAATRTLLERYAATDRVLRAETGAYRFNDFPEALLRGPAKSDRGQWLEDLGYRLDGRIDHLLLDEFQDTAPLQWWLIEPLAAEILAGGNESRTFFCVGDVKQSIYGWRGADPRLLAELGPRFPGLEPRPLSDNFRSARPVLDTVNQVFAALGSSPVLEGPERRAARSATDAWLSGFEAHNAARTELLGEVRTWRARAHQGTEKLLDPALELTVERVRAHHERAPLASIAVLVRARANIPRLRYLLKEAGLESSDEGGNPLTDSMAVTWILALLQLADHPGDGVAALQVARAGWRGSFSLELDVLRDRKRRPVEVARVARSVRRALIAEGYGRFCEARAQELSGRFGDWDGRRLEQLVDFALAHDARPGLRPIDFVTLVREKRMPDPTASRIQVMTVHASKGLEFDVVVLPELGKAITLTPREVLAYSSDPFGQPSLLSVVPDKTLLPHHDLLREAYEGAQAQAMTDALSSLYVAMTRAVHALELVMPAHKPSKKPSTALTYAALVAPAFSGEVVRDATAEPDDPKASAEEQATLVWEHADSTSGWADTLEGEDIAYTAEPAFDLLPASAPPLPAVAPSSVGRRRVAPKGARGHAVPGHAQRIGNLVHEALRGIEWLGDSAAFDAKRAALACARLESGRDASALIDEALARVQRALESPEFAALYAHPGGDARALNERSFDVEVTDLDEGPRRVKGAFDRLVLRTSGGAIESAMLVEFKTGAAPSIEGIVEAARAQVELYRDSLSALFGLGPERIEVRIAWLPLEGEPGVALVER